jgi:sugar lactone lactonase YvrE
LALSADQTELFIANTGDDRVLKLGLPGGPLEVFTESVDGADGLAMDADGRLWVVANQADRLVALNEHGRVIAQIGSFNGLRHGVPEGFLFPASIVIVGRDALVTNLALPLTSAVGDEPEEEVTRWTIARVPLRHAR